jgi:hypothetical protein
MQALGLPIKYFGTRPTGSGSGSGAAGADESESTGAWLPVHQHVERNKAPSKWYSGKYREFLELARRRDLDVMSSGATATVPLPRGHGGGGGGSALAAAAQLAGASSGTCNAEWREPFRLLDLSAIREQARRGGHSGT